MKIRFGFIVVFVIFLSTALFASGLNGDIKIKLLEKQVQKITSDGLHYVFYLNIKNSSSKHYHLSGYSYRLMIENKDFIRLKHSVEKPILIKAQGNSVIALPIKITYQYLFKEIPRIADNDSITCYLIGRFFFLDEFKNNNPIQFAYSGNFPVFRDPQGTIFPLKKNMLTIAGADIEFAIKIFNKNKFDFIVDRFDYILEFDKYKITSGRILGNKNISVHGEKVFKFSYLLNFYEIGKEVYELLKNDTIEAHFSGEMELKTIWGRLIRPFRVSQKINIIIGN